MASFNTEAQMKDIIKSTDKSWVINGARPKFGDHGRYHIPAKYGEWKKVDGVPTLFCQTWYAKKIGVID